MSTARPCHSASDLYNDARCPLGGLREYDMAPDYATVQELRRAISTEIIVALGLPRAGIFQRLLRPLVWLPAHRFGSLAAGFDRLVAGEGLPSAARWVLTQFVSDSRAIGAEAIPTAGPAILATNHPGSYDGFTILAHCPRADVKVIVSDVPILRGMYATSPHLIYVSHDPHHRMVAFREAVRHLKAGGALLLFASAQVDPDPALLPGAREELAKWSDSLALFMRRVPKTQVVTTIVSGVLASSCYHHPLTRLRRGQRLKQFLAEFLQIGQQLVFGRRFDLRPTVRFGAPISAADLGDGRDARAAMERILDEARRMLMQAESAQQ